MTDIDVTQFEEAKTQFTLLLPENPTESPRCWSGKMNTMLGFWGNACSFDNCLFFDVTLVTNLIRDILNIIQYMGSFERVGWKEGLLTLLESKSDLRNFLCSCGYNL